MCRRFQYGIVDKERHRIASIAILEARDRCFGEVGFDRFYMMVTIPEGEPEGKAESE